ncbi:Lipid-A-disaccharide synthase [uncultured delta proteobacterium]|uniref:Lipid-A-disaccharide synthase n=1 Tax=uncultured delta proteobacterium TaxID=34034 RepID=A0A212KH98_9DELT|nr:Lipid-A-disaccharide synthase [uncultured delta proteobacterium]
MNARKLWISAGELSGDMHGAALVAALRAKAPSLSFIGMGGPYMAREEAFTPLFRIEELSVMGVTEVLRHLPRILGLLSRIKKSLAENRPDAVIVIDAPAFHFRVIKAARELGIPVYYYISPKAWAWKEKRALFIKENVRRLISILPFEVAFYKKFGMDIDYVGNPLVDMVDWSRIKDVAPVPGKIGLLPGSRNREITSLTPEFGKAARILLQKLPHLTFHMVRAPGVSEETLRALWPADVPLAVCPPDDRYAFMRSCEMLIAASGTVTLEAALTRTPTLVTYKVTPISSILIRMVIKIPYVSLSNLILGKALFPELLQKDADGENIAAKALEWLAPADGSRPLETVREELADLQSQMGEPGAVNRAADVIVEDLP